MRVRDRVLNGVVLLELIHFEDERGRFVKPWHQHELASLSIDFSIRECFWSISSKGCIRGMHYQAPPNDHDKLVSCQNGCISDVVIDLRRSSPCFGQHYSVELSGINHRALYIPKGFAHGFQSLEDNAQVLYFTSLEHAPESDKGIHWDSFGFQWPISVNKVSKRDQLHPQFEEFQTPFE